MDGSSRSPAWPSYAAWGSLLCGLVTLLGSLAAGIHSDHLSNRFHDPWFLLVRPVYSSGRDFWISFGCGRQRFTASYRCDPVGQHALGLDRVPRVGISHAGSEVSPRVLYNRALTGMAHATFFNRG
jgi:hypothetical protein